MRSGEGVGLEPGDVDDGRVGVQRRPAVDAPLPPPVRTGGPLRVGDVVLLLPRPALVRPPLAALVAAALGEGQEGRVGDRRAADPEGRHARRGGAGARCRRRSASGRRADARTGRPGPRPPRARCGRRRAAARGARITAGARPGRASSIAWSIVSLCWCSWRRTSAWTSAGPSPPRTSSARSRTSSRYSSAWARSSSGRSPRTRPRRLERVVHRGELGTQQRLAAVAVARARGPRRPRCARGPTPAGS